MRHLTTLQQHSLSLIALFLALYPAQVSAAVNLQEMLLTLQSTYPAIVKLITAFCYVMGMSFAIAAIYHLKVYGELRTMMASQTGLREPLGYFMVSAVMLYLPTAIDTIMMTVFNESQFTSLSYATAEGGIYQQSIVAVLGLVQIVGLISFIRGWTLVKKSSEHGQRGGYGKGITHIIGGILAMNIVGTKNLIYSTFGF